MPRQEGLESGTPQRAPLFIVGLRVLSCNCIDIFAPLKGILVWLLTFLQLYANTKTIRTCFLVQSYSSISSTDACDQK